MPLSASWTYFHVPKVYLFHSEIHFTVDVSDRSKCEIQAAVLEGCQGLPEQSQGRIPFHSQTSAALGLCCWERLTKHPQSSERHSRRWGEPCALLLSPTLRNRDELGFWLFGPPALAQWISSFSESPYLAFAAQLHHGTALWHSLISGSV